MRNWLPAVLVRGPRRHADQQGRARSGRVWPPAEGGDRQQLCMSPRTHRRRGGPTDTASRPSWDAHGPAASGGTLGGRRGRPACSSPQKHRGRVRTSHTAPARCLVTARAAWLCRADRGRGADRTRGPHASHPELRPALPLGSDFITAVSLSEPPRASIRGARRRPAVAAPPHGSGRAPREQVPAALRLTVFICPVADGRWFRSRGPRGPGRVDAPGLTWRPRVLRPKRGDKRGGSRDPDVRWLVGF